MESHTDLTEATTAPEPAGECPALAADQPVSYHDARLSRILDYQASSLGKDDALQANLGSVNAGLMRIALWLEESIEQTMEIGQPNVERLAPVLRAVDSHLRLTRQIGPLRAD